MKTNYDAVMQSIVSAIRPDQKPRLMLQCCCAPCSSAVLERLIEFFDLTLLYYNPNTWPESEYHRRGAQFKKLLDGDGLAGKVDIIYSDWRSEDFELVSAGFEAYPEGGPRCERCFRMRLRETARLAKEKGYDWFCTTLSVSPHKNSELINRIGQELEEEYGVKYLPSDFKKREGYKRSIVLSAEYELYRQDYCGCRFSYEAAVKQREGKR